MPDQLLISRHQKLRKSLKDHNLDAVVLNPGPDLAYLTGLNFHLMERPVLVIFPAEGSPVVILPELESMKIHQLSFEVRPYTYGENRSQWLGVFKTALAASSLQSSRLGVIPRRLRLLEMTYLEEAAPASKIFPAQAVLASLRMVKDDQEIAKMREAARIAECALQATLSAFKLGVTEKEIASKLVYHLLHQGSDPALPFFPIVAFGPHTADPHAFPTDRPLQRGDLVLIDWGASVDGYFSDITRTFAMGEVDPEFEKIAEFVRLANAAGRSTARKGVLAKAVDQAARETIDRAGYGEMFIHRTGHGLGLEAHEEPYISADDPTGLAPGMTFTIEPGIYLPNRGGIRIEDDVLVTEHGLESFTRFPRELSQLLIEE